MKTRAVIMAGGEGSRLGILTAKRTKPAVPFAGKYRIIDFTLSNCVNSGIFDVMILAQYRPHSLIEHIGAGGPWDLNRDFTGGIRILPPYQERGGSEWFLGTADAVQHNFRFIKTNYPDLVLILSGDHIYKMNYSQMIDFHLSNQADLTIASIRVPLSEADRFGILSVDDDNRVVDFIEKPDQPPSNLANMGVYLFNLNTLDKALWEDHQRSNSNHDFGKDILPRLVEGEERVFTFPFGKYWVDVGTIRSYWQAHMDLLGDSPPIILHERHWIIHTRTEERSPVRIARGSSIRDSMITDGSVIESNAIVERSILSPGVLVKSGAVVRDSIIFTDAVIEENTTVERAIVEKRVRISQNAKIGGMEPLDDPIITTIGKNSILPPEIRIEPGAIIDTDLLPEDFPADIVYSKQHIKPIGRPPEY